MNEIEKDNVGIEEKGSKEINVDIMNDIRSILEEPNYAYPLEDVIEELKKLGYDNPGKIVLCAIQDEFLYIDDIEDDGVVYLAIVDQDKEE